MTTSEDRNDSRLEQIVEVYDAPKGTGSTIPAPKTLAAAGGIAVVLGAAVLTGFTALALGILLLALASAVAVTAVDGSDRPGDSIRSRTVGAERFGRLRSRLEELRADVAAVAERPR